MTSNEIKSRVRRNTHLNAFIRIRIAKYNVCLAHINVTKFDLKRHMNDQMAILYQLQLQVLF